MTPSLEFLQRLLKYREELPYILETKSEKVIEDIIKKHRGLLVAPPSQSLPFVSLGTIAKSPRILCTITSCKRLDLFQQTMNSILHTWKDLHRISEFLCIDDNSSEEDRSIMKKTYPFLTFYFKNEQEKGHRHSMNIIWSHLEKTRPDYWIHLEDDWLFYRERNYVGDALDFLERHKDDKIDQVLFNRNYAELQTGWNIKGGIPFKNQIDKGFLLHEKSDTVPGPTCAYWPHYSFRPSMIRVSTILSLGNYDSPNTFFERDYADRWFSMGFRSAFFNIITSMHIGKLTSDRSGTNAYTLNGVSQFQKQSTCKRIIVNLERRKDRRDVVEKLFNENGFTKADYSFYSAIDGEQLVTTPEIQQLFWGNDFGSRRGVIGCALSHYRIWQQLVSDKDADYYTIFEDDITVCPDFRNQLFSIEVQFHVNNKSSDLLFLGRHIFGAHPSFSSSFPSQPAIHPLEKTSFVGGTFGYILRKSGAQKLLSFIKENGICHGIDYVLKIQPASFVSQMVVPSLVQSEWVRSSNSSVDSDIQKQFNSLCLEKITTADGKEWKFYQGVDHIGDDICKTNAKDINELVTEASSKTKCVAVNSLGFLKHSVKFPLTPSRWFARRDGIWVCSLPKKIRMKPICNWTSSKELCDGLNKVTKGNYCWNNIQLTWNDTDIDYWIILNKPSSHDVFDPARSFVFQLEPMCGESYQKWGVKTWGAEWSRPDPTKFLYVHKEHTPVCWQGTTSWSEFATTSLNPITSKKHVLTHIASEKYFDPGHKLRIDFLHFLEEKGDIPLEIYGRKNYHNFKSFKGTVPDENTSTIISANKYYFMCENNFEENYITEKLWEPIMCETLCFYAGAPNVSSYVDPDSFVELEITDFETAYKQIKSAMMSNLFTERLPVIRKEKQRLLHEKTLFAIIEKQLNNVHQEQTQ